MRPPPPPMFVATDCLSHNVIFFPSQVVGFVATLVLSFPVIRFTVRLFAYVVTTRLSALLYKGNRCVGLCVLILWSVFLFLLCS